MPFEGQSEMEGNEDRRDEDRDRERLSLNSTDETMKRNVKRPTTDFETLIHLLKGNIGSGSLAMPQAFMNSGLWTGLAGVPVIGVLCIHAMTILLNSSRELCRRTGIPSLNYEETAVKSFEVGPKILRPWTNVVYRIITTFLVVTQLGFCCVYLVFVSQNLYQAVECISGGTNITQFEYMCIVLAPVLLICFLPDLKYLAPVSMIATASQFIGLIITFYYLVRDLPLVNMKVPAFAGWSTFPLFFGTAMYTFEGIGLVLPLENNMKHPNHFPGWTGVLISGMIVVVCTYCAIGFYGYLRYGDDVMGSITLNLPGDEGLAQSVKILMSLAIFLTYPLQYYVALSIMLPAVKATVSSKQAKFIVEYAFRSAIVFLTFVLAAVIPNIGLFTNLVGAVCASMLSLIFPPIIETVTFWPDTGKYHWRVCKNALMSFIGILGFVTGTYSSIVELVDYFQEESHDIETGC
ncbi:UNVERIFIED_CONTAM: hypothetical protein RMT77_010452 [Armadillidium vulgare]